MPLNAFYIHLGYTVQRKVYTVPYCHGLNAFIINENYIQVGFRYTTGFSMEEAITNERLGPLENRKMVCTYLSTQNIIILHKSQSSGLQNSFSK